MTRRADSFRASSLAKAASSALRSALLIAVTSSFAIVAAAQAPAGEGLSSDRLWRHVTESEVLAYAGGERVLFPTPARIVALDVAAFQELVSEAPLELTPGADASAPVMTLPMPDGSFARFAVQESPIMDQALAASLPEVRTFRARGLDDPRATARLDFTPTGFHGFVMSPEGTIYIDPFRKDDVVHYLSYWRRDYRRGEDATPFECHVGSAEGAAASKPTSKSSAYVPAPQAIATGPVLRTYRLALACTGEYAQFHGGTVPLAQAAMVTTMNRINGIYENEVAVRMTLVNNASIVFTNPAADPYSNTSGDLDANQTTIDTNIGSANYDIGHLVGTGGGGVAGLGVVCLDSEKAIGLTGSGSPVGDAFDVDYVAHELGHQFGANHTFNGRTGSCGGGNREPSAAYEPGSGSTIMAYAGICGAEDLQPHSDAYFHVKSFDEIVEFTTGSANSCAVQTSTGNTAPTVSAGSAVNIPRSTPFVLTGSGSDAESDPLTWCWEEFDLGTAGPPNTDNGSRPIFRSFSPVTSPSRTFPKLSDILAGTSTFGESLPTTTRAMTFRLTARDNRSGGGGVNYASTTVNVTSTAGPFVVTAPNTVLSWEIGSSQTVTWNVAGTTSVPVSCADVAVSLSTDGGLTFPTVLLPSTANDGTEQIVVPSPTTTTARVMVACLTQPFFDVSNANFTIAAPTFGPPTGVTATAVSPTDVSVSWNAAFGATSYRVYRSSNGSSYDLVGSPAGTSFTDATASPDTAYLYRVRSFDGAVESGDSSRDLATTVIFTDATLTSGTTNVKTAHLTELRTAVNAVRALALQSAAVFTDPALTAGATAIKRLHLVELRSALDVARAALTLSAVSYTDATVTVGATSIKAAHVTELRSGVQ